MQSLFEPGILTVKELRNLFTNGVHVGDEVTINKEPYPGAQKSCYHGTVIYRNDYFATCKIENLPFTLSFSDFDFYKGYVTHGWTIPKFEEPVMI